MKKLYKILMTTLLFTFLFGVTALATDDGRPPLTPNPEDWEVDYIYFNVDSYDVKQDSPEDVSLDKMMWDDDLTFEIVVTDSQGKQYSQYVGTRYRPDDNTHSYYSSYFQFPDETYTITDFHVLHSNTPVDLDKYVHSSLTFTISDSLTEQTNIYLDFDFWQFVQDNWENDNYVAQAYQDGATFMKWLFGDDNTIDKEPTLEEPTTEEETTTQEVVKPNPDSVITTKPYEPETESVEKETEPTEEQTTEADEDDKEDDKDKDDKEGILGNNIIPIVIGGVVVIGIVIVVVVVVIKKNKED